MCKQRAMHCAMHIVYKFIACKSVSGALQQGGLKSPQVSNALQSLFLKRENCTFEQEEAVHCKGL